MTVRIFLDTNALMCLSGLKESDVGNFKNRIERSGSELSITHVQVDEKYRKELRNYQQKIEKALARLVNKGINVKLEETKIPVEGVEREGCSRSGGQMVGSLYDELQKEIDACERDKGIIKPVLNIACDAVIAVSSLDHDFFITCDDCLSKRWQKIINKYGMLEQEHKIPKICYAHPSPTEVANAILDIL